MAAADQPWRTARDRHESGTTDRRSPSRGRRFEGRHRGRGSVFRQVAGLRPQRVTASGRGRNRCRRSGAGTAPYRHVQGRADAMVSSEMGGAGGATYRLVDTADGRRTGSNVGVRQTERGTTRDITATGHTATSLAGPATHHHPRRSRHFGAGNGRGHGAVLRDRTIGARGDLAGSRQSCVRAVGPSGRQCVIAKMAAQRPRCR